MPQNTTGPETTPDGYTTNVSTSQAHFDLVDYTTEKPDENNTLTSEEPNSSEQRKAEEEALKKRLALRVTAPGHKYP